MFDLLRREFPDYPVDSLPAIPSHWTEASWHNDVCPSFLPCDGMRLWVDYPNPESRELPRSRRFTLCTFSEEDPETQTLCESEHWEAITEHLIAAAFIESVRNVLTDAELAVVIERTLYEDRDSLGDFCDDNQVLIDAFASVMCRNPVMPSDVEEGRASEAQHDADLRLCESVRASARAARFDAGDL